ncbi:hypothetical protein [Polaromonas sp.]|uniref:COG4648 family protein n=2 Tax=Polaromonas sp. TaxID=1869339 RepID=UPI002D1FB2F1|nr:hypothetical protein [Polaromonas sp.]
MRVPHMAGWIKGALIALLIAGYAMASHFALTLPNGRVMATLLAIGVPAAGLMIFIFQWVVRRPLLASGLPARSVARFIVAGLLAVLPVTALFWAVWPALLAHAQALYFAQHVGTNALLAWVFGHTLAAGGTPLVVTFARMAHPVLPVEIEAYARKVTVAWTWFFLVTCAISVLLFFAAPLSVWSTFAVLLQWPSVVIFFVGEYVLRRRLFRHFDHVSLKQGFDAYSRHQSRTPPAGASKP